MKYIVYVSQAEAPFTGDELATLLRKSRERNIVEGISGLLVYRYSDDLDKGYFIQAIEGPSETLVDLWSRISQDQRHHTIVTLAEGSQPDRMFPNWSMGFKNIDANDLSKVPGFADIDKDSFWARLESRQIPDAVKLLQGFYDGG